MYITNHEDDSQKHGTKMYEEQVPKNKKTAAKNRPYEKPSLVNLSHVPELYEESGREDKNIVENEKRKNIKKVKESYYTNTNEHKTKEQAKLLKDENPKYHHKIPEKLGEMKKLWSPRKWPYLISARTLL